MKRILFLFFVIIFGTSYFSSAQEEIQNPKLKITFSERTRLTSIDNAILLNNDADIWTFTRHRTYLGLEYQPFDHLAGYAELGNEARIWLSPASRKPVWDEVFVHQLYLNWTHIGGIPVALKVGRQNLMFDEGFICIDAQPLTGSRSGSFNAAKVTWSINEKSTLTSFVSHNTFQEEFLPLLNASDPVQMLEEQTNTGVGLYYKTKVRASDLSLYYFLKNTEENENFSVASQIHALGARVAIPFLSRMQFTAEGAYQPGKAGDFRRNAYGGYFNLGCNLKGLLPVANQIYAGAIYLSGDDPATETVEGWDPLWSRWPKWSESYIYTQILENTGKVAYWSNMASLNVNLTGSLSEKVSFITSYHHLLALEDNTTAFCSGKGTVRGDLLIIKLNYTIDAQWSGHFLLENFTPGDFYFQGADGYNWIRFELMYKLTYSAYGK
ncbi:MAG TPA: alginate export family protein [Bacteroidales bacterium]|nr:alginate export family protein [Bacteroidales bacterium]HPE86736.1 alginate export family protein [Bacteroidales bacterium]